MDPSRPQISTRLGKARAARTVGKPRRQPIYTGEFDQRKAAATLRALRRSIRKSPLTEQRKTGSTKAGRKMRDRSPTTATNDIRSRLDHIRSAARICADILDAQAADLDWEVALTLRCICGELAGQIRRISRLLTGRAPQ
jgi:hypothetical protein